MRRRIHALLILFFVSITWIHANDGVYLVHGGCFYPTKSTRISIQKEILSFQVLDRECSVDVYFEFFNPDNEVSKLLVGFQIPDNYGDVSEGERDHIEDFTVMHGNTLLPFQVKYAGCPDCALQDEKTEEADGRISVYLFEIEFAPGVNKVRHSYRFPMSHAVYIDKLYSYIITTGGKWAGGKIKDFTMSIDMGANAYFFVDDVFGKSAEWNVIGSGKVTDKYVSWGDENSRMVRILHGRLEIKLDGDKVLPEEKWLKQEIRFGVFDEDSFISLAANPEIDEGGRVYAINPDYPIETRDRVILRLMRNTIYAQHGLPFQSKDLQAYFAQFEWYIPDPNLKMEDIVLSEKEKRYLEQIKVLER